MNTVGRIASETQLLVYQKADKPVIDCPTVYFHIDFIRTPSFGWTVDFTGSKCYYVTSKCLPCHENCMEGVLLKSRHDLRVWRLTGRADPDTDDLCYEGRWPD